MDPLIKLDLHDIHNKWIKFDPLGSFLYTQNDLAGDNSVFKDSDHCDLTIEYTSFD